MSYEVIIIGAGLAGLNCAVALRKANISFLILDSSDAPGGRIRTDLVDGYRLDRGFQVLLTAYPEARQALDYKKLKMKSYLPGAMVRHKGRFHRVSDPWRDPANLLNTLTSDVGTTADKLCLAKLQFSNTYLMMNDGQMNACSTLEFLKKQGFSGAIIEKFFRPFFGGVFLENQLETSSRNFEFLFRMFTSGDTSVPENGMEEIPKQLAEQIGIDNIRLNATVRAIAADTVWLTSGERLEAPHIVIATDLDVMQKLTANTSTIYNAAEPLSTVISDENSYLVQNKAVTCLYFTADSAPINEPILILNGEGTGPINNLSVPSLVSPAYAPAGKHLISATVLGNPSDSDEVLKLAVRGQLADWFGSEAHRWNHLKTYRIKNALPKQTVMNTVLPAKIEMRKGLYLCGDYMSIGSINGALESGRRAANLILSALPARV